MPKKILLILTYSLIPLCRLICLLLMHLLSGLRKKCPAQSDEADLVIFSQIQWWGPWQRPQELAMGMARYHRVLYINPTQIHERVLRYPAWRRMLNISEGKGVTVFSPLIFSGHYKWEILFRLNQYLLALEVRRILADRGPCIFVTNTPMGAFLPRHIQPVQVVYDVMDDFAGFNWAPKSAAAMHAELLAKADVVYTGTGTLEEMVKKERPDARFVSCGVHYEKFAVSAKGVLPEPSDLKGLARPIIGYVGTLSDRTDNAILEELSSAFPKSSIVLVGPVYRSMGAAPQAPNIHYLGLKPHSEVPAYIQHFKVAIMPFRLTPGSLAINPVKALEYLAAGCVVVSTAIPDVVRFYSDVILIASSPEDFVAKVGLALSQDNAERVAKGIELARNSTWSAMVETMEKGMKDRGL